MRRFAWIQSTVISLLLSSALALLLTQPRIMLLESHKLT